METQLQSCAAGAALSPTTDEESAMTAGHASQGENTKEMNKENDLAVRASPAKKALSEPKRKRKYVYKHYDGREEEIDPDTLDIDENDIGWRSKEDSLDDPQEGVFIPVDSPRHKAHGIPLRTLPMVTNLYIKKVPFFKEEYDKARLREPEDERRKRVLRNARMANSIHFLRCSTNFKERHRHCVGCDNMFCFTHVLDLVNQRCACDADLPLPPSVASSSEEKEEKAGSI